MFGVPKKWIGFVSVAVWMLLSACENDMQKVAALNHHAPTPEEAHGVDAYFSQGGKMKARLLAPYMLRYQQDTMRTVFPQSLHVDFYDSLLVIESRLDARYGVYYDNLNKVYLSDHVKILNLVKKDTIYCQDLYWDQNSGKFYTHREVEVHSPNQTLYGTGMTATQDFSDVIMDSVHGPIRVQNGQLP
jgi:LPS export ABC transporter protein LptC